MLRPETKQRLDELMALPMTDETVRILDNFFDGLPPIERGGAANYGVELAQKRLDYVLEVRGRLSL